MFDRSVGSPSASWTDDLINILHLYSDELNVLFLANTLTSNEYVPVIIPLNYSETEKTSLMTSSAIL